MQPNNAGKSEEYEKAWRQHAILLALAPFISGCGAGMVATVVVQPINTLKVRMQLMQYEKSKAAASSMSLIRGLIVQRRVAELYNGLSAGLLRVMMYGTARIGLFTTFESMLQQRAAERGTSLGFGRRAVASMSAGALATTIGNPTEVTLIRMQANGATPGAD
ncbi:hypothetical protein COCSADRAFT_341498 [Bipolaris sorokiniana ND90Pr]|uniref:Uncharacterized protein n=2 Tax=Cochliobolus sativus TaxID=45130 RepID=M2TK15_COCSN|nr:uncharacterized protein COCSADRAFT_341498 [Bipolaris sorokiniana ND90Pr]EMD69516.1 hypothetical protein COCSADRAFT_341498 [Bipolaris sorokiniana ND90Pr]